MTKTLTKQWREGTLDNGYYYVRSGWSKSVETRYLGNGFFEGNIEVLAPVPSYDEYKELVRKADKLDKIMADTTTNPLDCMQIEIDGLNIYVERLQKQLNEANHILKDVFISDAYYKSKRAQYLKRWGVK